IYLMLRIRLDLAYTISIVSRYFSNLDNIYKQAVKYILKYIQGIKELCLVC
ncbi:hypothetical protein BBK36DRAFT_1131263, partial [Trichoderma citrinoviride]